MERKKKFGIAGIIGIIITVLTVLLESGIFA